MQLFCFDRTLTRRLEQTFEQSWTRVCRYSNDATGTILENHTMLALMLILQFRIVKFSAMNNHSSTCKPPQTGVMNFYEEDLC